MPIAFPMFTLDYHLEDTLVDTVWEGDDGPSMWDTEDMLSSEYTGYLMSLPARGILTVSDFWNSVDGTYLAAALRAFPGAVYSMVTSVGIDGIGTPEVESVLRAMPSSVGDEIWALVAQARMALANGAEVPTCSDDVILNGVRCVFPDRFALDYALLCAFASADVTTLAEYQQARFRPGNELFIVGELLLPRMRDILNMLDVPVLDAVTIDTVVSAVYHMDDVESHLLPVYFLLNSVSMLKGVFRFLGRMERVGVSVDALKLVRSWSTMVECFCCLRGGSIGS